MSSIHPRHSDPVRTPDAAHPGGGGGDLDDAERIAEAIAYIEAHWRARPSLDDIAQHIGLSKFHFQRLFSRWAGISPKRYAQYLTIDRAKELLAGDRPLLDVSLDLELSGPSRLHDLFVSIDAVTPGDFKKRGADLTIRYGTHPSPFGFCVIGLTPRGVCFLGFTDDCTPQHAHGLIEERWPGAELDHAPQDTAPLAQRIFQYTGLTSAPGSPGSPDSNAIRAGDEEGVGRGVPLLLSGTNFQIKVWEALLRIPAGSITTYQDIANIVGRPNGSRAVGQAVGANHISYLIPCHRVLRKGGLVGGYAWGPSRKHAMLWREAAQRAEREAVA